MFTFVRTFLHSRGQILRSSSQANADKSALVVIRAAPVMVARLRHPDGWLFQVKDATKTLGLTYGDGFDTAKILVNECK